MVFGKLLKIITKECNLLRMRLHHIHKGLHDGVLDGCRSS
ncbi:Uncharacterised protein [Segatella copri]|nr:Uncharacterised protein [Segatella copri]